MKNILPFCFLLLTMAACQSKKGFEINGNVENQKDGQIFFVNLHTEEQDTVIIKDGKFSLSGVAEEPTPFLIFSPEVLPAQTILFADQGTTKISFKANDPASLEIKGCATQKEYEKFNDQTKPLLAQFDSIQMLAMSGQIDNAEVQRLATVLQQQYENVNLQFVKAHPASYVSALLAYEYLRQKPQLNSKEKKQILASLAPEIQQSFFGNKMLELINADEATAVGNAAPNFSLPDPSGKEISLNSFKGKYVLIDFWASWCGPCRAENPNVVAAYNKYRNKNFTILGVSLDENKKQWETAIQKDNLKWTQVSDLKGWNSSVVSLYNIKSIPSNVLLDREGNIVAKDLRSVELENQLSNLLK